MEKCFYAFVVHKEPVDLMNLTGKQIAVLNFIKKFFVENGTASVINISFICPKNFLVLKILLGEYKIWHKASVYILLFYAIVQF
ncbi:MAG: hypothetical protein LBN01_04940 [Endomicrobium sp.]|jgi:peptidoglycan biosynthesis protein MviN/MurJ (putative lipid II flippase)|nr:hypothetical protein [Endomicrobium sp.]